MDRIVYGNTNARGFASVSERCFISIADAMSGVINSLRGSCVFICCAGSGMIRGRGRYGNRWIDC